MSEAIMSTPSSEAPADLLLPPSQPARRRVVIVDDDATTVVLLRRALEVAGFEVVGSASNGPDGIEIVRQTQPDLILIDYSMPGMDGAEAIPQLLAIRSVPIVMLTGHSDLEHIQRAIDAGASTYLVKPVTSMTLLPAIQTACDVFAMAHR